MRVYGHRGASMYAPQNTLAAFELAFKMGAYGIENDVHMTSDGQIVVIHNANTQEMCGKNLVIRNSSLEQLQALEVIDKSGKYPGQKIPTLEQTYELMKKYPEAHINVELKAGGIKFLEKVLDIAERFKMKHRIIYSTFLRENISWLHANRPDVPTALLCGATTDDLNFALQNGCMAIHPDWQSLNADFMREAHEANLEVNCWTVDYEEGIKKAMALGVDGIISDCPDVVMNYLSQNK